MSKACLPWQKIVEATGNQSPMEGIPVDLCRPIFDLNMTVVMTATIKSDREAEEYSTRNLPSIPAQHHIFLAVLQFNKKTIQTEFWVILVFVEIIDHPLEATGTGAVAKGIPPRVVSISISSSSHTNGPTCWHRSDIRESLSIIYFCYFAFVVILVMVSGAQSGWILLMFPCQALTSVGWLQQGQQKRMQYPGTTRRIVLRTSCNLEGRQRSKQQTTRTFPWAAAHLPRWRWT